MENEKLMEAARKAAEYSYSPYSRFRVGAALLCENGEIITGTNVENSSYGLTNCAERSALFAAVSRGIRNFKAIAIYSPDSPDPLPPCGACRQALSEFVSSDFPVYFSGKSGDVVPVSLGDLFPYGNLKDYIS